MSQISCPYIASDVTVHSGQLSTKVFPIKVSCTKFSGECLIVANCGLCCDELRTLETTVKQNLMSCGGLVWAEKWRQIVELETFPRMSSGYWPQWQGRRHRLFWKQWDWNPKIGSPEQAGSLVGGLGGARVMIASRKSKGETGDLLASAKKAGQEARDVLLAGAPLIQLPSRCSLTFLQWYV